MHVPNKRYYHLTLYISFIYLSLKANSEKEDTYLCLILISYRIILRDICSKNRLNLNASIF
jgi:hypothetical protein